MKKDLSKLTKGFELHPAHKATLLSDLGYLKENALQLAMQLHLTGKFAIFDYHGEVIKNPFNASVKITSSISEAYIPLSSSVKEISNSLQDFALKEVEIIRTIR